MEIWTLKQVQGDEKGEIGTVERDQLPSIPSSAPAAAVSASCFELPSPRASPAPRIETCTVKCKA